MPNIELRITKAAQTHFLRSRKQAAGVVARQSVLEAITAGRASLQVPQHLALDSFETDARSLAFGEPGTTKLHVAAAAAGFESAGEYASRLLHALHMHAEPEGTATALICIDLPNAGPKMLRHRWPVRMGQRGRVLVIGDRELLLRGGFIMAHDDTFSLFQARLSIADGRDPALQALRQKIAEFAGSHLGDPDPLIAVQRIGRGPTDKSAKFCFEAVHVTRGRPPGEESERKKHEYLLPVSQLREIDGGQYMPAWVINKKLRERREDREKWVEAVGVCRSPADVLYAQLAPFVTDRIAAMSAARQVWLANAPTREATAEQQRLRNEEERKRAAQTVADTKAASAERVARLAARKAAKVPDLVLEGARVEWSEWVGPSSNRKRVDHVDEPCTVRFFCTKREITLPDGGEIVKMQGTHLRIFDSHGALVQGAHQLQHGRGSPTPSPKGRPAPAAVVSTASDEVLRDD